MAAPVVAGAAALLLQARPELNPDQVKALLTENRRGAHGRSASARPTSFAVLAGSTVTNTGPSTIDGDLGRQPRHGGDRLPAGIVTGTTHAADAVALKAKSDLTAAYDRRRRRGRRATPVPADLGGLTLTPGVYGVAVVARADRHAHARRPGRPERRLRLPGRLDADHRVGEPRAGSSTARRPATCSGRSAAPPRSGPTTVFAGSILALASITMNDGVDAERPGAGAQRRRHADQRHDHRRALRVRTRRASWTSPARCRPPRHRRQPGPVAEPVRRAGARRGRARPHARRRARLDASTWTRRPGRVDVDAIDLDGRQRGTPWARDLDVRTVRSARGVEPTAPAGLDSWRATGGDASCETEQHLASGPAARDWYVDCRNADGAWMDIAPRAAG